MTEATEKIVVGMIVTVCGGLAVSFITAAVFAGMTLMALADRVRDLESEQHEALHRLSTFYQIRLDQADTEEQKGDLTDAQKLRFNQLRAFVDWFEERPAPGD